MSKLNKKTEKSSAISEQEDDYQAQSMMRIVFDQFKEHRMAMAGFYTTLFFVVIAFAAPLIAHLTGLDPDTQNVFKRFSPPMTKIELSSEAKEIAVEQYITTHKDLVPALTKQLIKFGLISGDTSVDDALYTFTATKQAPELIKDLDVLASPEAKSFKSLIKTFSSTHWLGTDELGRDVFIRLVYATQVSIGVGILVAIAASLIGLIIGVLAGYYGSWVDNILMRITDSLLSLPILPLMIVFAAIDLKSIGFLKTILSNQSESLFKLVFILCLFSWMSVARLVRGSVLSIKEREFVLAAKTLGAGDLRIMLTHISPNVIAPLLVSVTLNVGNAILFESALSFLGLGIQPPTASWGNMLFNAQELIYQAPALAVLPGILILVTTISFNFIGDGLQDAIDPKSIKR